jgi:hypothetical protein
MFVADAGIALWIGVFFLIGGFGFFVMAVALLFRFIGWLFRTITGVSATGRQGSEPQINRQRHAICPHPGCGHANGPTALYCGRCGRPLRRAYDVDAYG